MRTLMVVLLTLSCLACSVQGPTVGGPPPRLANLGYGYETSLPLTNPLIYGHHNMSEACPAIDRQKVARIDSAYIYENDPSVVPREQKIVFPYMLEKSTSPQAAGRKLGLKASKLARDFERDISPVVEKVAIERGYLIVVNEAFYEPKYKICFGMLTSINEEVIAEIKKSEPN